MEHTGTFSHICHIPPVSRLCATSWTSFRNILQCSVSGSPIFQNIYAYLYIRRRLGEVRSSLDPVHISLHRHFSSTLSNPSLCLTRRPICNHLTRYRRSTTLSAVIPAPHLSKGSLSHSLQWHKTHKTSLFSHQPTRTASPTRNGTTTEMQSTKSPRISRQKSCSTTKMPTSEHHNHAQITPPTLQQDSSALFRSQHGSTN